MTTHRPLEGRVAFVTGATSGLGQRFAIILAAAGARVVISGRRQERLAALADEISANGGTAAPLVLDVTDPVAVQAAVAEAEARVGPLWLLVNNSGVSASGPVESMTEGDYDFVMDTNVKGAYFMAQAAGRAMLPRKEGRIINVASLLGVRVLGQLSLYAMSKAAVIQMTKALALEWARHGINVNAICPGYIETEMNSDYFRSDNGQAFMKRFPRRRIGQPEDLDGMMLTLADPASRFTTGAIISVDDGQQFM
jgi:NAD(P)-dependent dehydrogenase (short-subunit alcohol dehydrogenase family)